MTSTPGIGPAATLPETGLRPAAAGTMLLGGLVALAGVALCVVGRRASGLQ